MLIFSPKYTEVADSFDPTMLAFQNLDFFIQSGTKCFFDLYFLNCRRYRPQTADRRLNQLKNVLEEKCPSN